MVVNVMKQGSHCESPESLVRRHIDLLTRSLPEHVCLVLLLPQAKARHPFWGKMSKTFTGLE
jgi:hypothetical protein